MHAWLTRFDAVLRRIAPGGEFRRHAVHRRLTGSADVPGGDVLHARLLDAVAPSAASWTAAGGPLVLDAGCGLGGTTRFLQGALGGRGCGLTLSAAQAARATAEARRRGMDGVCRFVVRSYDAPLDDLLPEGADLIVAIESLAHADDPEATIGRLARVLRPRGRLVVVDDMPAADLAPDDPDVEGFRRGWQVPAVATASTLRGACDAAGLRVVTDHDLTPLVPRRASASLAARLGAARLLTPLLGSTPAGVLLDALRGGLHLERLYARGRVAYRLIAAERPAA
ncbi:MAG: methyltransferase domain-containing protein [Vicinamibacterales bacterium]